MKQKGLLISFIVLGIIISGTPRIVSAPRDDIISVRATDAEYKTVTLKPNSGWFKTGQDADIVLSAIDFNNTGGPLLFNHQGNVASDGTHLLLADRNNNRILIWNMLPAGNTPPDLVLGQKNFITNNPGTGPGELNWPVSVAVGGGKVIVADTNNDRILIWNHFPAQNGTPADFEIHGMRRGPHGDPKREIVWPWAVWTNGKQVIVTSTGASSVLIWNSFPTEKDQPADISIRLPGKLGTPRSIGSDGRHLVIGDHNASGNKQGAFFWKTFPAKDDAMYDFFVSDFGAMGTQETMPRNYGSVLWGPTITDDGKLIGIANCLYMWSSFPENETDGPALVIGSTRPKENGYDFGGAQTGDGSGIVSAGKRLYISLSNGNKIVGFNTFPSAPDAQPDFVIGSPSVNVNTLESNFIISNPTPVTDGTTLFVSSDFDRKLYVWKNLPDESGSHPDFVYSLPDGPWDNALFGNTLVLAGRRTVYIWRTVPRNGEKPDIILRDSIGNITLKDLRGVALDGKYFYLADSNVNKIYIWEGIPSNDSNPMFTITTNQPARLSSDGNYLIVTATMSGHGGSISVYDIPTLSSSSEPLAVLEGHGIFNLPQCALVSHGHLFVADTSFSRVLIWKNIEDAVIGKNPDVILGEEHLQDTNPEIGRDKLFWPAVLAFDGSFLWVGEFKFSERILRFSIIP